jgi:hypothetical protein
MKMYRWVEAKLPAFLILTLLKWLFSGSSFLDPDIQWTGLQTQILRTRRHRLENNIKMELKEILWTRRLACSGLGLGPVLWIWLPYIKENFFFWRICIRKHPFSYCDDSGTKFIRLLYSWLQRTALGLRHRAAESSCPRPLYDTTAGSMERRPPLYASLCFS